MRETDRVREHFTRSAVAFDSLYAEEEMSPLWRWANRVFRRDIYERYLRTIAHVRRYGLTTALDVGCGSGPYELGLAEAGVQRVVGVDFSPTMIDLATRRARGYPEADKRFEFVCADFMEFKSSERFDVVIAMGFFDYIRDPVPVLRKMAALANHSVVGSFPSISLWRTPIRKARYVRRGVPVYFYQRPAIEEFASRAGFRALRIEKIRGSGMDYFVTFLR
jgi:SAM-dependent methyltransferase